MNSRAKGAEGEREIARILRGYGYECRRGQQYSGANGDADVVGLPGIHIECKRVERLNISDAMAQSVADARIGEKPAVFHRKNCEPWKVTMLLEDWMKLYKAWRDMQWISCKERLPKIVDECVLVRVNGKSGNIMLHDAVEIGEYYGNGEWRLEAYPDIEDLEVTHWMPLPAPPESDT